MGISDQPLSVYVEIIQHSSVLSRQFSSHRLTLDLRALNPIVNLASVTVVLESCYSLKVENLGNFILLQVTSPSFRLLGSTPLS